jgi:hypothetical protein
MASVHELIAAAEARNTPYMDLTGGFNQGLQMAGSVIKMRAAQDSERRADDMDRSLRSMLASAVEDKTQNDLRGVQPKATPPTPAMRLAAVSSGEDGRLKPRFEPVAPATKPEEFYNADQTAAIASGDSAKLSAAFGGRVPKDAIGKAFSAERISNTQGERANRDAERTQARFRQYLLDIEQRDPVIKTLRQQDIGIGQVNDLVGLVKEGNTVAAAAMGTKMARGMGEVGVLTESDISRYVQSGQLDRKAGDTLSKWLRGVPTDATLGEIQSISGALRGTFDKKIQPRYDQFIDSYAKMEKMTPQQMASELSLPYVGKKAPAAPTGSAKPVILAVRRVGG